jgi:hypothetical protein
MAIRSAYSYPDAAQISKPIKIEGRERLLVFVSAPNALEGKLAYPKTVSDDAVARVRERLNWPARRVPA